MIVTIIIWCYISLLSLGVGFGFFYLVKKCTRFDCQDISIIWTTGLCIITVYAEYYSLFCKVGMMANIVLSVSGLTLLVLMKKQIKKIFLYYCNIYKYKFCKSKKILNCCAFAVIFILFLCISSQKAHHSDTDLYHAQAIRWIEEYGVVKGLGNLHNRFAYNSAFMCLQALFSGSFMLNQSTHVVNGYIAFVFAAYAIFKVFVYRRSSQIRSSDLFGIAILVYICNEKVLSTVSSPNTDLFALLLVLFILHKWCESLEKKEENIIPYCILCLLGLFSISVKLSTAMIMMLLIKPIINMLKGHKWKEITFFIFVGIIIIAPYMLRNIVISGYLIYPYSFIDVFPVDWKMAKSVVDFDNREIMAYARGLNSYFLSNYSFVEWFPIWWEQQNILIKVMMIINIFSIVWNLIKIVKEVKNKKIVWDNILLFLATGAMLMFWMLTAPNMRYGIAFLFGIPCVVWGSSKSLLQNRFTVGLGYILITYCAIMLCSIIIENFSEISLKRPAYYIYRECEEIEWNGIKMYISEENCYCGYYYLPALPYKNTLNFIELRGDTIGEGFKVKDEDKDIVFNNSGMIYEPVQQ